MRHTSRELRIGTNRNPSILFPIAAVVVAVSIAGQSRAENWGAAINQGWWGDNTSWQEATIPNAVGAAAIFPSPSATRTVNLGGAGAPCPDSSCNFTTGSLDLTNDSGSTSTIRNGPLSADVGSLTFDAAGSGPATITSHGAGTNQSLITATMVFNDTVDVNVTTTAGNASAGLLSLTGNITGAGGLTKDGPGTMTMAFISGSSGQVKSYQGPTIVNNGVLRLSQGGAPNMTSSVTVNSGGQLLLITGASSPNTGIYTFGANSSTLLTLNGSGPTANPGAIRVVTANTPPVTVTNLISLAGATAFNVNGSANILDLSNKISGNGSLIAGGLGNAADTGTIQLDGANDYSGGTTVSLGTLSLSSANATLGTGNVTVDGTSSGAAGKLIIKSTVLNAIADSATLTLTGGGAASTADQGYVELDHNETVAGLVLGGVTKAAGTYGSSSSSAAFKDDEYFTGTGILTVGSAGVAGDYNGNGVVDMADYVLWRDGGPLQNEVASTGTVDAADYDAWRARFGNTSGSGSGLSQGSSVPEPVSVGLLTIAAICGVATTRRRTDEIK